MRGDDKMEEFHAKRGGGDIKGWKSSNREKRWRSKKGSNRLDLLE